MKVKKMRDDQDRTPLHRYSKQLKVDHDEFSFTRSEILRVREEDRKRIFGDEDND
jgi:hypothetical protein